MRDYRRFVILTTGRSGSTWLAEALNSHDEVVCFGSLFEVNADYVSFDSPGYDNFDDAAIAQRDAEPLSFLRERVFGDHPARAVGFKIQYTNWFGFPGLLEELAADAALRVIHLRRRNLLRTLASLRLAERTGQYHAKPLRVGPQRMLQALRHPLRAVGRLRSRMETRTYAPPSIRLSVEECREFFMRAKLEAQRHDELFAGHDRLDVDYEEMVDDFAAVSRRLQQFLGVTQRTLTYTQRPLNAAPARDMIANYDELRDAFQGAPSADYMD